jgi:hypothetical protein
MGKKNKSSECILIFRYNPGKYRMVREASGGP